MSIMRATMDGQADELRRILSDAGGPDRAAERLAGRRILLIGTGTSWHAANAGAWFLRAAGAEAWAVQGADAAMHGPRAGAGDGVILLSHRGTKRYTSAALADARANGAEVVTISGRGVEGADIETTEAERSSAFTASHTAAMLRVAQIAVAMGADLGPLTAVPDTVAAVLSGGETGIVAPDRLLEFAGAGINQWTAAEAALKVRETCYVATEGHSAEQLLHGPIVALGEADALVCLNGGGPGEARLQEVARSAESTGVTVQTITATYPSELLSVFPLTAAAQRIALELAEARGTDPDTFGKDLPSRAHALDGIEL